MARRQQPRAIDADARARARVRGYIVRRLQLIIDPALTEVQHNQIIDACTDLTFVGNRLDRSLGPLRNHFVVGSELTAPSRRLLHRALKAASIVYESQVRRLHMLDPIANDLILPQQIWEIARLVDLHSRLENEQRQIRQGVVMTAELQAVLRPQQQALERSVAAVTERVATLERYAHNVQAADAALRAREALNNNDRYLALLAHTDDAEGMQQLALQAESVERTLAKSIHDAIDVGRTLSL
ncbi:hypothetical protein [Microbispora sp. H13382]|uniref:hypothetical protein n=1 Tax=Microbispora sp. H13382 TaxID=2729112 RepID=UPI001600A619|nr:hypothetical protein [Microbispora sp. H13382]